MVLPETVPFCSTAKILQNPVLRELGQALPGVGIKIIPCALKASSVCLKRGMCVFNMSATHANANVLFFLSST